MWKKRLEFHESHLDTLREELQPHKECIASLRQDILELQNLIGEEQPGAAVTDEALRKDSNLDKRLAQVKRDFHRCLAFTLCVGWTILGVPLISAFLQD
jgi:hypothetical protein